MTLESADKYAAEILAAIKPFCAEGKCVIAGSVRRRSPSPGDIEIVALPITTDFEMLDGLRKVVNGGKFGTVEVGPFPSRYTRLKGPHCKFDLFWQSRESYGLNLFIRTGPAEYAARALAFWKKVTNGGYSSGAVLHLADGTPVKTWTEEEVFEVFDKYAKIYADLTASKYVPVKWLDPTRRK